MRFLSITAQVAEQLRDDLIAGRWSGTIPGVAHLSRELRVSRKTVEGALHMLESEGILEGKGQGRRRRIVLSSAGTSPKAQRLAVLDYDPPSRGEALKIDLRHSLQKAGHQVVEAPKTLRDLGMRVDRVRSQVREIEADAWIVVAGSRGVLKWFAGQGIPAFALFGRRRGLPIAGVGPDHVKACRETTRHLIELGHRRIVVLVNESQRSGGGGSAERAILDEMEVNGIPTGAYNLPDWEDSAEGFHRALDGLLRISPPTAFIIDEPSLFHAAKHHLAQRGILPPRDVSLICTDPDPTFAWCRPSIAYIRWSNVQVVNRVVRWAGNIARGKADQRQTLTKAEYVDGGTVGPAPDDS